MIPLTPCEKTSEPIAGPTSLPDNNARCALALPVLLESSLAPDYLKLGDFDWMYWPTTGPKGLLTGPPLNGPLIALRSNRRANFFAILTRDSIAIWNVRVGTLFSR